MWGCVMLCCVSQGFSASPSRRRWSPSRHPAPPSLRRAVDVRATNRGVRGVDSSVVTTPTYVCGALHRHFIRNVVGVRLCAYSCRVTGESTSNTTGPLVSSNDAFQNGQRLDGVGDGLGKQHRRRKTQLTEAAIRAATEDDLKEVEGEGFLLGVPLSRLSYESCRWACNRFQCRGYSNLGVKEMRAALVVHMNNHRRSALAYAADGASLLGAINPFEEEERDADDGSAESEGQRADHRPVHRASRTGKGQYQKLTTNSIFRAYNCFFHPSLVDKLGTLGDLATRDQLDRHHAGVPPPFWSDAAALYGDHTVKEIDEVQHSHRMFVQAHIDPSNNEPADAKTLKALWDKNNRVYKVMLENSKRSGTHAEFYKFVKGRMDILYLHLFLTDQPNVASMVQAQLPPGAGVESSRLTQRIQDASVAAGSAAAAVRGDAAEKAADAAGRKRKGVPSGVEAAVTDATRLLQRDAEMTAAQQDTENRKVQVLEQRLIFDQQRWAAAMRPDPVAEEQQQLKLWHEATEMLERQVKKVRDSTSEEERVVFQAAADKLSSYCDSVMERVMSSRTVGILQGSEGESGSATRF
eukprot:GHVU01147771.1.p1 GENE.GHVU01147771.1~~GHVU01147771.1.p1  ORF type:complete len:580 (+),score=86.89 GHVU01147771.1:285-2024(+)